MRRFLVIAIVTVASTTHSAWAQQPVSEPVLNVTIDPPRVAVGQRTTLRIDVLAPNYMTSPPELPGFQVRNAVTRQLQNVNLSEQRNGTGYAGVRFEFAIYPQEPGSYAIAEQKLMVRYAADPPAVRQELLVLPLVSFVAFVPDEAAGLNPYIATSRLTIDQSIRNSSDQLKVGDSVIRSVTLRAVEIPSMLLPPVTFPALDGLAVYPAQPLLQDKTEGREDALTATRTDSATYILQRPGKYVLPPIDVRWWNAGEGRIETAHLDAVTMQVTPNPFAEAASTSASAVRLNWTAVVELVADHWVEAILVLAGLLALARIIPRTVREAFARRRRRRAAYLQSERYSFDRLRLAAGSGDAEASYFALLDWLRRFAPFQTIDSLKAAARDPILEREVTALETHLYASRPPDIDWSPRRFIRHVSSARRSLRRASVHREALTALPLRLNPEGAQPSLRLWRQPAR